MAVPLSDYRASIDALFARTGGYLKPGLSRTRALLDALGAPHERVPSFHVAGTNGKGSVCATIDALLRFKGLRVGRYTSPHLVDFRERIVVDGVPIGEGEVLDFLRLTAPLPAAAEATFFELTTAMALWYFAQREVDVAVIETGLGGRFDSTNVITPLVATVTNISLDHTEYLGPTLEAIADEKAGIFKPGRPAVIGERHADLTARLAQRATEHGATPITLVHTDWRAWSISLAGGVTSFTAGTPLGELSLQTPLYGEHQARNAVTAIASVAAAAGGRYMPAPGELNEALAAVRLPGRFQRAGEWVFDVAHNAAGARALASAVAATPLPRPVTAVVGVLGDKDWQGILDALAPVVNAFVITQPESAPAGRAWDPMTAALHANRLDVPVIFEVDFATAMTRAAGEPGTKLVAGSFHTVGDAMRHLGIDPLAPAS